MIKKSFLFTLLSLNSLGMLQAQEDKIVVHSKNDAPWEIGISELRKIEVSETGLNFIGTNGQSLNTKSFLDLEKISFNLTTSGILNDIVTPDCFVYPNPATDFLNVAGWNSEKTISIAIYSINGQLMDSQENWNGGPISVTHLPQGLYLLKLNNQTFKFRKL